MSSGKRNLLYIFCVSLVYMRATITCPACHGLPCQQCGGSGAVPAPFSAEDALAWVEEQRKTRKWREIAEELGITRSALNQWMQRKTQPSRTALLLIEQLAGRAGSWPL